MSSRLLSKNLKIKIYKTIILPVVLYGCETWSLTLREECRLRLFENRILKRIFGPKSGEGSTMRNFIVCTIFLNIATKIKNPWQCQKFHHYHFTIKVLYKKMLLQIKYLHNRQLWLDSFIIHHGSAANIANA